MPSYWPAIALRGQPLSAALSSPASAARVAYCKPSRVTLEQYFAAGGDGLTVHHSA